MAQYKIVAIIWEDHSTGHRTALPNDPDDIVKPTISIGIIAKKTAKSILIVSDVEKYSDRVDTSFWVILRKNILAIKEYGEIEIENLR